MAKPEHLQILEQGVEAWNAWREQHWDIRPDFRGAYLFRRNLHGANLCEASLCGANLGGAYLHHANLEGVSLYGANLDEATFYGSSLDGANLGAANLHAANLGGASLRGANLGGAYLGRANLSEADLSGADVYEVGLFNTIFGNTNLTAVVGLETCRHEGPSTLAHRTLAQSGPLPLAFLRGCGLNDWEIEATKLYDQSLTSSQVTDILYRIYHLRTDPLIQFYRCFISHASQDHQFVERM